MNYVKKKNNNNNQNTSQFSKTLNFNEKNQTTNQVIENYTAAENFISISDIKKKRNLFLQFKLLKHKIKYFR